MQQNLIVGDTLAYTTALPDYPAGDGWTLTYRLVPRVAGTVYTIAATPNGDDYDVAVSATDTALWTAGEYSWAAYVEKAGERYTIEGWASTDGTYGAGTITLKPDPGVVTAYDGRSQARKAVDDLRTAMATYSASHGTISEYEIAGRRMKFRASAEILEFLSYWQTVLNREDAAEADAKGFASPRRYYLRAGRA